jgi:hypothetical protein
VRLSPFLSTHHRPRKKFVPEKVCPTVSKNLNQLDLLDKRRPQPAIVDPLAMLSTITRRPTLLRAMHLAVEVSGLEDKQIYEAIDIDASHWTRIKNGTASMPLDECFLNFLNVVGNEIPLVWLAEKRGYDWGTIRKHRSDLERENEELKKELADHKRAVRLLVEARGAV